MAREKSGPLWSIEDIQDRLSSLAILAGSARRLAKDLGVSPTKLHYVLKGEQLPNRKIESFLGVKRVGMRWEVK